MPYISILLLVAAATADSLVIGFNYGVKSVRINIISNAFISLVCYAGTLISMLGGKLLAGIFSPGATGITGGIFLALLGGYMLYGALDNRQSQKERFSETPDEVDKDCSQVIELRESLLIGLLLSLNNMWLGVGAGIAGYPVWLTPLACAAFSFVFIIAGRILGSRVNNPKLSHTLEVASALLIILLGGGGSLSCIF